MKKKKRIAPVILFVIVAAIYGLLIELSRNTVWGWVLAVAVMTGFFLIYKKSWHSYPPCFLLYYILSFYFIFVKKSLKCDTGGAKKELGFLPSILLFLLLISYTLNFSFD